jgi:hypothetical protein
MDERIETDEATEIWMYGRSDEHPDRHCPNCDEPIDVEQRTIPDTEDELLLCPECGAQLPWCAIEDVPVNDWFNWVCLEKKDYAARKCFDEPKQKALRLDVSLTDPRGGDVGLEITRTCSGDVLVKVENRESFTYFTHAGTSTEGSYTVVRFKEV